MRYRLASAAIALAVGTIVPAHAEDSAGLAAYMAECSKCHGVPQQAGGQHPPRLLVAALGPMSGLTGLLAPDNSAAPAHLNDQLAVVLPYGPNLRGVIGRPAGSVEGFIYSKKFLRAMQGRIWDTESLDKFITDTQKFVRGTRMYYRQPDETIRNNVVQFLTTHE